MSTVRSEKEAVVQELVSKFQEASLVIVADYRGLNVAKITNLRQQLKKEDAELKVYKNTLMKLALKELKVEFPVEMFEGPSAVIVTKNDVAKTSKVTVNFSEEFESLKIKGGVLSKVVISDGSVQQLAKLPSREELIAKVIGSIKSPLTGLVGVLSGPMRGLVYVLQSIKDKKQSGGE